MSAVEARSFTDPFHSYDSSAERWHVWQQEIMALLEKELGEAIGRVRLVDVDWMAWRPLYEEGRTARSAVDRALERDL